MRRKVPSLSLTSQSSDLETKGTADANSSGVITLDSLLGGNLEIDLNTGEYTYSVPRGANVLGSPLDVFVYAIENADGLCLFVDPVGDIAVLTVPDTQELHEQADQYEDLTENRSQSVPVGPPPESKSQGWLLSLENTLLPCKIETVFHTISV